MLSLLNNIGITNSDLKFIIIVSILSVILIIFFVTDLGTNPLDDNFMYYLKNHNSGSYLKDIYLDKDFIILYEDFFVKEPDIYEINDAKKDFLWKNSFKYNIVVYVSSIYGNKYLKLVEYCRSCDLPICRIVDLKPSVLVSNKKTLDDGTVIYYYTRNK